MSLVNDSDNLFLNNEQNLRGKLIKYEKLIPESQLLHGNTHQNSINVEEQTLALQQDSNSISIIDDLAAASAAATTTTTTTAQQTEIYINGNDIEELQNKLNIMCRFCLAEDENLRKIFDEYNCISDMFFVFASVQLTQNDGLPDKVCFECLTQLTKCINFKQQVETAEIVLKHFIEEGYKSGMTLEKIEADNLEKYAQIHSNQFSLEFIGNNDNDDFSEQECNDTDYYEEYDMDDPQTFPSIPAETNTLQIQENDLNKNINSKIDSSSNKETKKAKVINDKTESIDCFNCQICDRNFRSQSSLNRHKKMQHSNFTCMVCNEDLKNISNKEYKKHLLSHSKIKIKRKKKIDDKFQCHDCNALFNVKDDLFVHGSIHLNVNTDGKYICRKCDKKFTEIPKLKRHVRIHFIDKPYKCEQCGLGFPEMCSLKRHFRKNHSGRKKEKKFICKHCDKKYFDGYALMLHTRTHTDEKPYACNECNRKFTDIRLLHSHRKTHLGIRTYECKHCEKKFIHQSTLTTHLRTHTGEKPYACNVCNKYFIQSSNLRLHMRVHSGEKPYKCDFCSKSFSSSSSMRIHRRIHTGEKPYSCPQCNKSFGRSNISSHLLTHTKEKRFMCKICEKPFTTSSQLKVHFRSHTGEKPYVCEICKKCWSNLSSLKKHMNIHNAQKDVKLVQNNETNNDENILMDEHKEEEDCDLNESLCLVNDLIAAVTQSDLSTNII